jgi:hypothetical protein
VTNLAHQNVELSSFDRLVLAHADGTRDAAGLVAIIQGAIDRGELTLENADGPTTPENLAIWVGRALANFQLATLLSE